ncbi:unnamed protein product, partial [Closterium sp. Naga37s-1]
MRVSGAWMLPEFNPHAPRDLGRPGSGPGLGEGMSDGDVEAPCRNLGLAPYGPTEAKDAETEAGDWGFLDAETEAQKDSEATDDEETQDAIPEVATKDADVEFGRAGVDRGDAETNDDTADVAPEDAETEDGNEEGAWEDAETEDGNEEGAWEDAETVNRNAGVAPEDAETEDGNAEVAKREAETENGNAEVGKQDAETEHGIVEVAPEDADTEDGNAEVAPEDAETEEGKPFVAQEDAETEDGNAEGLAEDAMTEEGKPGVALVDGKANGGKDAALRYEPGLTGKGGSVSSADAAIERPNFTTHVKVEAVPTPASTLKLSGEHAIGAGHPCAGGSRPTTYEDARLFMRLLERLLPAEESHGVMDSEGEDEVGDEYSERGEESEDVQEAHETDSVSSAASSERSEERDIEVDIRAEIAHIARKYNLPNEAITDIIQLFKARNPSDDDLETWETYRDLEKWEEEVLEAHEHWEEVEIVLEGDLGVLTLRHRPIVEVFVALWETMSGVDGFATEWREEKVDGGAMDGEAIKVQDAAGVEMTVHPLLADYVRCRAVLVDTPASLLRAPDPSYYFRTVAQYAAWEHRAMMQIVPLITHLPGYEDIGEATVMFSEWYKAYFRVEYHTDQSLAAMVTMTERLIAKLVAVFPNQRSGFLIVKAVEHNIRVLTKRSRRMEVDVDMDPVWSEFRDALGPDVMARAVEVMRAVGIDADTVQVHTALAIPPHDRMERGVLGHVIKASPAEQKFSHVQIEGQGGVWYGRCLMLFHFTDASQQVVRRALVKYYTELDSILASNAGASLGAPASAGKPVVSASAIEVVSTARFPAPAAAVAVGAAAASGTAVASAGASASEVVTAASEVVKASLVVETLMILGSLAKPSLVDFHSGLCGAPSVWGTNVQALLLWDVTGGLATGYHVPCVALQAFASADCSGVTAGRLTAPPPAVGNVQTIKLTTPLKSFRCVITNICQRAKCPPHSKCIKTNDNYG